MAGAGGIPAIPPLNIHSTPTATADMYGQISTGAFQVGSGRFSAAAPSPAALNPAELVEAGGAPMLIGAAAVLLFALWKGR